MCLAQLQPNREFGMTKQDKGKAKGSEQTTVGGGGAATSAGILFQQQVGAVIGSRLLAERPLDHRLNLGQAKPAWIRFETEAPVDDILVGTSTGGFVAVQAKTKVSLSKNLGSEFGKTVSQFVRHWLACRDGEQNLRWNRPLDAQVDRLVLAVGPSTPVTVREVLPAALRLKSQPGGGQLNANQQRAFSHFETCVRAAWTTATAADCSPAIVLELAALINVLTVDASGSARDAAIEILRDVAREPDDAPAIFSGLETVCGELMAERGGVDGPTLRGRLLGRGMKLLSPPDFRPDIARLKDHSEKTARTLKRFEEIEAADGKPISVVRECQGAILDAVLGGSLLIIGEPGAGKSGVLNSLARDLMDQGSDVLELAVDGHSVETLEGLRNELGLQHGLVEILEAWDGTKPAWLVVDGLDASRGGPGGAVFRTLIERVVSIGGRWKVIASIRTFDLRMGQTFQRLFKGTAPIQHLAEHEFSNVRHARVPPWTQTEFAQLLEKSADLADAMTNAPKNLLDVAMVPFNTRLLNDLVKDNLVTADLSHVASQAELLQLYWSHRVEAHGASAQACIFRIVKSMVEKRVLRAPFETAAESDAAVLDALEGEGVLVSIDNRRGIQFRHHLLFDFAAARVMLDPEEMIVGRQKFGKSETSGLMLAQALRFVLQEIWMREPSRAEFWTAAAHVLADQDGDPVIRSAASRICAEIPGRHDDMVVLAERVVAGDEKASQAFDHVCGAFGIRLEDDPSVELAPWTGLVRDIETNVALVCGSLRFLLFRLVGRVDDHDHNARHDLGIAARGLLDYAFSLDSPGNLVSSAIDLVGDTYASDVRESRALLEKVFEPDRLAVHAANEVPAICQKIDRIARADPEFTVRIYRETFGFEVTDVQESYMSDSQILTLRSDTRQDYGMARYLLKEHFGTFLGLHPDHAIQAVVHAVEAYVDREHPRNTEMLDVELSVGGRSVRLREDWSHIWAHDPESDYGDDAEALIRELLANLRSTDEAAVTKIAERLVETASLAIFWSRLFLAASERDDKLLDFCLPIAMRQEFLTLSDTVKDAVDLVAKGYECMSVPEREAFEAAVSRFDFSKFSSPDDARADVERRLFGEIGETNLATGHARAIAKARGSGGHAKNDRPFAVTVNRGPPEPYHWIHGVDRESPANQKLIDAIERVEGALGLKSDAHNDIVTTLEYSLREMEDLVADIDRTTQDPGLVIHAEGQISECICHLVDQKEVPAASDHRTTSRFRHLLLVTADSAGPVVYEDTEENFEKSASWGSPAPRVDAAKAVLELARQRPDLYRSLIPSIDDLLQDRHPAVRLEAALRLVGTWGIDRAGFWQRLSGRLADEQNLGVIEHVCSKVLWQAVHADPERTEQIALALLRRFEGEPERHGRLRKRLCGLIAILWVRHQRQESYAVLEGWIDDAATYVSELSDLLATLRMAFIAGLAGPYESNDEGLRHRAQAIAAKIVAVAKSELEPLFQIDSPSTEQQEIAHKYARLLDAACTQLYFAAKAVRNGGNPEVASDDDGLEVFFQEVAGTLTAVGDFATPHTVHYLLQLCEFLLPVNPARAFDLAMHAVRSGGQLTGYQFESMGADLLVKLVGLFLADHNEIFEEEDRRNALIECLEIFMDAGWPAAQRLLYRLPELIQ